MIDDRRNFVVARLWPETTQLAVYAYGKEVFCGNDKEAGQYLEYVKATVNPEIADQYQIVWIDIKQFLN